MSIAKALNGRTTTSRGTIALIEFELLNRSTSSRFVSLLNVLPDFEQGDTSVFEPLVDSLPRGLRTKASVLNIGSTKVKQGFGHDFT